MSRRCWPLDRGRVLTSGFGERWGAMHWGIDLGRDGGSGRMPVYAAQAGTVVMSGPANGFGFWVVIDHPTEAGGGTTVYGHIIPEVAVGQLVIAGQRIAHINPDSRTNGGVPPHLHFEVHRAVWSPPGPNRLDPLTWLADAVEPDAAGGENMPGDTPETITYGVDISNHQAGLDLSRVFAEGFEFVIAKVSEGDYFRDRMWPAFRDATLAAGRILVGYHYVRADCDIEQQAELFVDHLGYTGIPAMLDHEANSGGIEVLRAVRAAIERRGVRCALTYLPRWYWSGSMGSPDLTGLPPLMSSHYGPNRSGIASMIYPGDHNIGWQGYGGLPVAIFQFSERGAVAGRSIDVDAFRGTSDQLRNLLTGDDDMAFTEEDRAMLRDVWVQLRGPDAGGWPQLGQNDEGQNLTPVDKLAELGRTIAALPDRLAAALSKKAGN